MPTVRRAQQTVDATALPRARFGAQRTAEAEGAGTELARGKALAAAELRKGVKFQGIAAIGEQAERMGAALFRDLQEKERKAAHETAMLKASNALSDGMNAYLYDPEKGALNRKGEAALPLPEEARDFFEKLAGDVEKTMSTDEQRAAFARLRGQEWQQLDLQVRRHTFGEMQSFRQTELENHVGNSANAAMQAANDPKLVAVNLQKAVSAIKTSGPSLGLGPEAIAAKVSAVQSKVHVGVISNLLAEEKDQQAQAYFEATQGQIGGEHLDGVKRALEEGGVRATAQKKTDEIMRAGGTLREKLEKAKDLPPKVRDEVERRLEHAEIRLTRERNEAEAAVVRQGYDIIDATGDVSKIPTGEWATYDGATRSAMIHYAKLKAQGVEPETDWSQFYRLMDTAAQSPADFQNTNLYAYRPYLGDAEFKQLVSLQGNLKSGNREANDKVQNPLLTHKQLLDNTLVQHGINPDAKYDSPEGKAVAQLRRMLQVRVNALQAGGKEARTEDVQSELDNLLGQSREVPGSWWNVFPGGAPFRNTQKRLVDHTIRDIPAADRKMLEDALRARQKPINDAAILDLWMETQARRRR